MAFLSRLVLAFGLFLPLFPLQAQQPGSIIDGVAAIVNDKVITFSEVKKLCDGTERSLRDTYSGPELASHVREARRSTLKSLIEKELIIQDFNKKQFFIPESVVDDRLKETIQSQFDGDRTAFTRTMQANGVSLEQYKDELRNNMIVGAMRDHNVSKAVIISPFKIEKYYQENVAEFTQEEQIKISIILLRKPLFLEKRKNADGVEEEYDPAAAVAKEILFKLDAGADFAEMARAYSEGKNRETGGDWGMGEQEGPAIGIGRCGRQTAARPDQPDHQYGGRLLHYPPR